MRFYLLEIQYWVDLINEKENGLFAEFHYRANTNTLLEIAIRLKEDYSYLEKIKIDFDKASVKEIDSAISALKVASLEKWRVVNE